MTAPPPGVGTTSPVVHAESTRFPKRRPRLFDHPPLPVGSVFVRALNAQPPVPRPNTEPSGPTTPYAAGDVAVGLLSGMKIGGQPSQTAVDERTDRPPPQPPSGSS